ncbi:hypothetical protein [Photobacterium marinum]|uniref:hypothetical protein n=1 Tax=Photobacterium marinum TaxID=1056511 RepID=UPI000686334E|nr:hypothetical protein [Photobacterium marinum]
MEAPALSIENTSKRYRSKDSCGRITAKHIGDQYHCGRGTKHCIVTLVERLSGYNTLIGQLDETYSLNKRVIKLINKAKLSFKTITADGGANNQRMQHPHKKRFRKGSLILKLNCYKWLDFAGDKATCLVFP